MRTQRTRVSAYALIREPGRVLLCRLSAEVPRWKGSWTLPGGGLNFGESPEQAMVREVEEETGLKVEPVSIAKIDSLHDTSGDSDFHGIRIIYHVRVAGGALRNEVSGSTDCCAWHEFPLSPSVPLVDLARTGCRLR
ncbi:MAG: nudI [Akkermansiaceae bacterium]|nr:nudI [Akkermansiaceae bacterium]